MTLLHVDVCSGIGGFPLAARWAGFTPALFCEIDAYCRYELSRHWPEVPCHDDICTLTAELIREYGVGRIDLFTGGYPCQPFSVAGKRRGESDPRHLWPHLRRIVAETRPRWTCFENVDGHVSMGLDAVFADLESEGYEVGAVVLPAAGVGAWHRRYRVFILAQDLHDAVCTRSAEPERTICTGRHATRLAGATVPDANGGRRAHSVAKKRNDFEFDASGDVSDADHLRQQQSRERESGEWPDDGHPWLGWDGGRPCPGIWQSEPPVGRVAHGLPRRVDRYLRRKRIAALGNGVPPQLVYPVLVAIAAELRGEAGRHDA